MYVAIFLRYIPQSETYILSLALDFLYAALEYSEWASDGTNDSAAVLHLDVRQLRLWHDE